MLKYPQGLEEVDPELEEDDIERRLWADAYRWDVNSGLSMEAAQIIAVLRAQLREKS